MWGIGGMAEDEVVMVPAGPSKCQKKKKIHDGFIFSRSAAGGNRSWGGVRCEREQISGKGKEVKEVGRCQRSSSY